MSAPLFTRQCKHVMLILTTFVAFGIVTGVHLILPILQSASDVAHYTLPNKSKCVPRWKINTTEPYVYRKRTSKDVKDVCKNCLEGRWIGKERIGHGQELFKRSVFYCNIPKCASSFLTSVFTNVYVDENKKYPKKQKYLQNVYSFMFVRNPYIRLFSAYENKLFSPGEWWSVLGKTIISEVRRNASATSEQLGHDVTFKEFITYTLQVHEHGMELQNRHIAPMHSLCNPCRKKFDFIGKLETITKDLPHLLNEWKSRGIISNKTRPAAVIGSETKNKQIFGRIGHMFWAVRSYRQLVSVYKLFQRNWASYQMRGIILKTFKMPLIQDNVNSTTIELYKSYVETAINASKKYKSMLIEQRNEALVQAYRTVTLADLMKLQKFVETDCTIFGYDAKPALLFKRNLTSEFHGHDYFKWL